MNDACAFRGQHAVLEGPSPALIGPASKESREIEKLIGGLDQFVEAAFGSAKRGKEVLPVRFGRHLRDLIFDFARERDALSVLPFCDLLDVLVILAMLKVGVIAIGDVCDVEDRLEGQQEEVLTGIVHLLLAESLNKTGRNALFQNAFEGGEDRHFVLSRFIMSDPSADILLANSVIDLIQIGH